MIDFGENTGDFYYHDGVTASTGGPSVSYGVGKVSNYEKIGDYGGPFVNVGGSYSCYGVDYCRSPDLNPNSTSAWSATFNLLPTGVSDQFNGYVGWDYYYQIGSWGGG